MPGLIFHFPEGEHEERTRSQIERKDRLTIALPFEELRAIPRSGVALIGLALTDEAAAESGTPPSVEYLAHFRKSPGAATSFQRRLVFESFSAFSPIELDELRSSLPQQLARHFVLGPISPKTWQATLAALRALRPEIEGPLDALLGRGTPPAWVSGQARAVLGFERDAFMLSMRLAGIDVTRHARGWVPSSEPAPFLVGLSAATAIEDQVLAHDMEVFGDWRRISRNAAGAVTFSAGSQSLTVVNVNRTSIEATLGADLIYYAHTFDAFVLVQYKMLSRNGKDFEYRPASDRSLSDQLEKLRALPDSEWDGSLSGYRLAQTGAFLKFCYREVDLQSTTLASGLYLPIDLWDAFSALPEAKGPRGGTLLRSSDLPRHLTNTQFANLVGGGWVGTRGVPSRLVEKHIRSSLEARRSITLARTSDR